MLGNVIRSRRKKMNITLQGLSSQVGITTGGLSQIERGMVDPSLSVLRKISKALNMPMNAMFAEENESCVTRKGERQKAIFSDVFVDYEFLTPVGKSSAITPKLEVVMVTLKPGAFGGDTLSIHDVDECFTVTKGQITVEMENENIVLNEGDSLYLTEGVRHRLRNTGDGEAVGLSIMSGMTF